MTLIDPKYTSSPMVLVVQGYMLTDGLWLRRTVMRETAAILAGAGNASRAAALLSMANLTRDATLALFVKGTTGDPGGYFAAGCNFTGAIKQSSSDSLKQSSNLRSHFRF